jgi:hypothetical protein
MTTCTPLKPFRCWRHKKGSKRPIPAWLQKYDGNFMFLRSGRWFVDTGTIYPRIASYSESEFKCLFKLAQP